MIFDHLQGLDDAPRDVCIVGAGPVGITLALELARAGKSVLLLESGGRSKAPETAELSAADIVDPARHDAMDIAVARQIGGTSNLWAGRCQPFDPIDFEQRPSVGDARWPFPRDLLLPYYARACAYAHCGGPVFRAPPPAPDVRDDTFDADRIERFSNKPRFYRAYGNELERNTHIDLRLNATVVDVEFGENGCVRSVSVSRPDGARRKIEVKTLVLACGGLETTRLLLAFGRDNPQRFGGVGGPLGRYYMGHVIGEVADITFAREGMDAAYDFYVDEHGSFVRRRIIPSDALQRSDDLPNVSFWPVVPPSADPRHGNAILSMVILALSIGPLGRLVVAEAIRKRHVPETLDRWPHVMNVLRGLPASMWFLGNFFYRRHFTATRLPGFFVRNSARTYGLSYHSEHFPDPLSRVVLSRETDRLGLPRLSIDLRFSEANADAILRTHVALDGWLRRNGLGSLEYRQPLAATRDAILSKAAHGTHQIGTTRMGLSRSQAVLDGNLKCFDADNLYVVSTSAMPTSGQANPTLTALALAVRLADHLSAANAQGPGAS